MLYKDNLFNQFINLLFKKGKKSKIQKFILHCFLNIRLTKKNPGFLFIKAIFNVTPVVGLKKQKKKGKLTYIPKIITKKQKNSIGIKWILKSAFIKKNNFCEALVVEIIESASFKSISYKKKIEVSSFLEINITNDLFMRIQQLLKVKRKKKQVLTKVTLINGSPQKKGTCLRVFTMAPRKPNSAVRKVARVQLSNKQVVTAYIPGEKHSLQEHALVLVRGGKVKDLPGVRHKIIRGVFDCTGVISRKSSRSKYGVKKNKK